MTAPLAIVWLAVVAAEARPTEHADYLRDVKPLLQTKCFTCHGALKQSGGLRLDTREAMLLGGDGGPAIIAGKSGQSQLLERLTASIDQRMPPEGEGEAFKPDEIAKIRAWIDAGAHGPANEKPEADPREHWAFRPPVKPPVPKVRDPSWSKNPIDAFIAAEHVRRGLTPLQAAEPSILLRRVYLDLVGLPPTQAELDDKKSYEAVVEKLLASPQYGERWGRHWMDVWRYSDWWGLGAEVRNSQKHIWHWRDWIIESLNADKGYDQMVREMLAADELYPTDADRLRATGYLARNYFKFNRTSWLDEVLQHTSKGFLGLTLNCCKCHDHKYDPFSQLDYYRLRAYFEPYQVRTDQVPGQIDFEKDGVPRVFDCNLDVPTYVHTRGDDTRPQKDKPLEPGLPPLLAFNEFAIAPVSLPAEAYFPGLKPFVLDDHLRDAEAKVAAAKANVEKARKSGEAAAVKVAEKSLAAVEKSAAAVRPRWEASRLRATNAAAPEAKTAAERAARAERDAALAQAEATLAQAEADLAKADAKKKPDAEKKVADAKTAVETAHKAAANPGAAFTPLVGSLKTLESNLEKEDSRNKPFPTTSTGRRTALARWFTDRRNPLTARVAVNHIWARHFGRPLVPTVFDFGRKGQPPTHPELLDYLAVELMEHDWSMKHLHRLMVTSQTYRLAGSAEHGDRNSERNASSVFDRSASSDPENRYYWRRNSVRMEAQIVRDSLLHLAGELDSTLGGPSIPVGDDNSRRRSLYFVHSHNDHNKFLALFDDAGVQECYRRSESIVPQQALALANSKLALNMAEKIASHLAASSSEQGDDGAFVDRAWRTILCGAPSDEERAACLDALRQWRELATKTKAADPAARARSNLVEALINHNDFVTIR